MKNLKHLNYKTESFKTKYLNCMQRNRFLQLKNISTVKKSFYVIKSQKFKR